MAIETEQAPNRLFEPLAPPIPKGEIHRTTGRGRQRLQQRRELLAISRVHIAQFWQQSLKLQGQLIGAEGPMPRIKSPRFAAAAIAIHAEGELEVLHLGCGSAANRERYRFGERKAPKRPAHRPNTPIPKLAQAGRGPH